MAFEQLKQISSDLEENILILEEELRDTSNILYQYEDNSNSKGIKILEDLSTEWRTLSEELEEIIKQDEEYVNELNQELESVKIFVNECVEKGNKYENVLIQKDLLVSEENHSLEDENDVNKKLNSSPPLVENTFLVTRLPQAQHSPELSREFNDTNLQNTICDFDPFKMPAGELRKTFVVQSRNLR